MRMQLTVMLLGALLSSAIAVPAEAGNKPCAGKKGGISHCRGADFVCRDGSISQSRKICPVEIYGKRVRR